MCVGTGVEYLRWYNTCGSYLSISLPLAVGFVFLFFAGLVLLCYEKQHCSEMTEDNSLQDNEERNNLLLTSRSVAAAWDGFLVRLRNLVLYVIYGITDVFHLWYGWPREP